MSISVFSGWHTSLDIIGTVWHHEVVVNLSLMFQRQVLRMLCAAIYVCGCSKAPRDIRKSWLCRRWPPLWRGRWTTLRTSHPQHSPTFISTSFTTAQRTNNLKVHQKLPQLNIKIVQTCYAEWLVFVVDIMNLMLYFMCVEWNCYYVFSFSFVVFLFVPVLFACATILSGEQRLL